MANSATANEAYERQQALVEKLIRDGNLTDPRVEAAFRSVPRHLFLPELALEEAYKDDAIPTKRLPGGQVVSSSSQPAIMAIMLEQLALEPGMRVLEIGAGTGYNAALMSHIVGATGQVIAIDIDDDIVEAALDHLSTAGYGRVQVVRSDGALGYPDAAPYDRMILTVAAWDIAPAWREQLKADGQLVLPLDIKGSQKCVAFRPEGDHLESLSARPCAFMELRGVLAAPHNEIAFGPDPQLYLITDTPVSLSADELYGLLTGPPRDFSTEITVVQFEVFDSLSLWLGIHEPAYFRLAGEDQQAQMIPPLFSYNRNHRMTFGLFGLDSLCTLMRSPVEKADQHPETFTLMVRLFGPDESVAHRLIRLVRAWDAAGRPDTRRLHIRVFPREHTGGPSNGEITIDKQWSRLALSWV